LEAIVSDRGAVIAAASLKVENDRPQLAAALDQVCAEKVVIAVAWIDWLARDAGFVFRLANEADKKGIGGFVFC